MATPTELAALALQWSQVIQTYMEIEHSTRLEVVPKGDAGSIASLLANWSQAIPNTYPEPTEAQLLSALATVEAAIATQDAIEIVEANAEAQIVAIPNFAHWTEAQFLAWIDANISNTQIDAIANLADAKVFMEKQTVAFTALMRMVVGLRNKVFPNLESS